LFLHYSLKSFSEKLKNEYALDLQIVEAKKTWPVLKKIIQENKIKRVFWNRLYDPHVIERDQEIKSNIKKLGIEVVSYKDALLWEPWEIKESAGKIYQVYTPFFKACMKNSFPQLPDIKAKKKLKGLKIENSSDVQNLNLLTHRDWENKMHQDWEISEDGAQKKLKSFLASSLKNYNDSRNIPSEQGTSMLSPYLHWGLISIRQVWDKVNKTSGEGPQQFLKELVWREFAHHLLFHFPQTTHHPLRENFNLFPWKKNNELLSKWKKGLTGYPIVDAGMRQLWATGWMHNRVRMIVASFLVKDLRIHWLEGAKWFWETLVDANLANNTLGWQWSAGSGADAAPYFRIFNPITQGEKFDPKGEYIFKWIPQLKEVPLKYLHKPWEWEGFDEKKLKYPKAIVDHATAREEALAAFQKIKTKK
jgi:deoxyribodipyrimidine photo-lyase